MQFVDTLIELLEESIAPEELLGGDYIIRDGFNSEIDDIRTSISKSQDWVDNYQQILIEQTGIKRLKIKGTQNAGYIIEIPKTQSENIPESFHLTQTLTQSQRYTTPELRQYNDKILSAQDNLANLENSIFLDIYNSVLSHFDNVSTLSRSTSFLDFIQSASKYSLDSNAISPEMNESYDLEIIGGVHPVISQNVENFISNDIQLTRSDFVHSITGPNMGGKSTYLRQNALLILMAHMGYDIPVKQAKIGLTDGIYSRVGAGDNLFLGQSTFMVEMQEISYILRHSTNRSFVIIDEIGRGTSTYDGMALAWSILLYNVENIGAKTLFATHYHEIIDFTQNLKGVSNYSVAVGEENKTLIFLRKIIPGGVKKSYGIDVARLAGIPEDVIKGAKKLIATLEQTEKADQLSFGFSSESSDEGINIGNTESQTGEVRIGDTIIAELRELDINSISPVEALNTLDQMKRQLKNQE